MHDIVPVVESVALRKAQLIEEALHALRSAQQFDERDDLNAASFLDWYDRTIPDVQDIKILAGAMEIELARRRGEQIIKEGERRGRPEKLTHCVSLPPAEHMQRSRERALAAAPDAVHAFVQREVKAGKVPSMRGAVGVARAAHATAAPQRVTKLVEAAEAKLSLVQRKIVMAITKVGDGERRTESQIAKLTGYETQNFLNRIRLVPWLRIDRTADGVAFHIDTELRAICEGRISRPALSYQSIDDFLHHLRTEIARKRKENRDEREKTRWDSRLILTRIQSDILDWIEQQLDRVPTR